MNYTVSVFLRLSLASDTCIHAVEEDSTLTL